MVSSLRKNSRFPGDLEMEVYAGIVGQEAAIMFMRWLADHRHRPVTAAEVLDAWPDVSVRAAEQRDDLQAATINDLIATLQALPSLAEQQERYLVEYIAVLPRDLRFGCIKSLLKIPPVALAISQDKYDPVVFDAMRAISSEALGTEQ
jgi:hypothetical protein